MSCPGDRGVNEESGAVDDRVLFVAGREVVPSLEAAEPVLGRLQ